mmetsp:Transcript_22286/g.53289  ORF Transcript_22286/g.53289 Transcript_22286/m.53289 type:complete len:99 (+) Transcript_22286:648-944(+)
MDCWSRRALESLGQKADPSRLLASERLRVKQEEAATLRKLLDEAHEENAALEEELGRRRAEAEEAAASYGPISAELQAVEAAAQQWRQCLGSGSRLGP